MASSEIPATLLSADWDRSQSKGGREVYDGRSFSTNFLIGAVLR